MKLNEIRNHIVSDEFLERILSSKMSLSFITNVILAFSRIQIYENDLLFLFFFQFCELANRFTRIEKN